jgi:hypothetical protein
MILPLMIFSGFFINTGTLVHLLTHDPSTFADTHLIFSGFFINTDFNPGVPGLDQVPLAHELKMKKNRLNPGVPGLDQVPLAHEVRLRSVLSQ